jgi:2-keto-3-deoxy-6-phosphogluconate aldolase
MVASIGSAVKVRVYLDIDFVGGGTGTVLLAQNQSNMPGFGAALGPGPGGNAQTMRLQVGETVAGVGGSITEAQLLTALQNVASDFAAASGSPIITPAILATINGWATGNP